MVKEQVVTNGVFHGRFTAEMDDSFVVFLIGARLNNLWRSMPQMPWFSQTMPKMLNELYRYPEKGFLGGESFTRFFPVTTILVSYWQSYDALEHFARSKEDPHLKEWQEFTRRVGTNGRIGVWHETYLVEAGAYETVYSNMPVFGLAKAGRHVPVTARSNSSRGRLNSRKPQAAEMPEVG